MARSYKKWVAALILALPTLCFATNGMNDIGVGAKAKGMGGVGIAFPKDSFVAGMNPAGMVKLGCRYDLGIGYVLQDARETILTTGSAPFTSRSTRGLWYPEMADNWKCHPCQSLGLTLFIYGAINTKYNPPANSSPLY